MSVTVAPASSNADLMDPKKFKKQVKGLQLPLTVGDDTNGEKMLPYVYLALSLTELKEDDNAQIAMNAVLRNYPMTMNDQPISAFQALNWLISAWWSAGVSDEGPKEFLKRLVTEDVIFSNENTAGSVRMKYLQSIALGRIGAEYEEESGWLF